MNDLNILELLHSVCHVFAADLIPTSAYMMSACEELVSVGFLTEGILSPSSLILEVEEICSPSGLYWGMGGASSSGRIHSVVACCVGVAKGLSCSKTW